jgi:hypothetical protein
MDKESLLEFITKAHRNTYAAPKEIKLKYRCKTPLIEGHKEYDFIDGDWRYHDTYAGTEWAPGSEVVLYKGQPVWRMSYQGQTVNSLSEEFVEEMFGFLKEALRNVDEHMPFRGPALFARGDFIYKFAIKGDYRYFTGRESVTYKDKELLFQDVIGAMVK